MKLPTNTFDNPVITGDISDIDFSSNTRAGKSFVIGQDDNLELNFILSLRSEFHSSIIVETNNGSETYDCFPDFSFIYIKNTRKASIKFDGYKDDLITVRLCICYEPPLLIDSVELIEKLDALGRFQMLTPDPRFGNLIKGGSVFKASDRLPLGVKLNEGSQCVESCDSELDVPDYISMETTGFCNLTCVHCPQGVDGGMPYPPKTMGDDIIEKMNEAIGKCKEIVLNGYGEPLASGRIWNILERLRDNPKCRVGFNTNGHLLNKKIVDKIVNAPAIKFIHVSVDAATPETYRKIRGDDLSKLIKGISLLKNKLIQCDRTDVEVRISMVLMQENLSELANFVELGYSLGVDVQIWNLKENNTFFGASGSKSIGDWFVQRDDWSFHYKTQLPHLHENYNQLVLNALQKAKDLKVKLYGLSSWPNELLKAPDAAYSGLETKPSDCVYIKDRLMVFSNGDVRMCCYQIDSPPMGNLKFQTLDEVWHSDNLNDTKAALRRDEIPWHCSKSTCIYIKGR